MRRELVDSLLQRAATKDFVFLTGDVGFGLLEPLREALGERFINCGVAEQNMVSTAAGLAQGGWEVWVYTIAPFCYARAFEQIRNDLSFHKLPVKLLGSGGGYAYGTMGPSHHALEDYGVLLTLDSFPVFVPTFPQDLTRVLSRAIGHPGPCYLRLEQGLEAPEGLEEPQGSWRRLCRGTGPKVLSCGPLAADIEHGLRQAGLHNDIELWSLCELPLRPQEIPADFLCGLASRSLLVAEEHVRQGGLASQLSLGLLELGCCPASFESHSARGYPSGLYGGQAFHRKEVGLDRESLMERLGALAVLSPEIHSC